MKVLVTGASGMLGRAVATALLSRGEDVTVLQRSDAAIPGAHQVRASVTDADALAAPVREQDAIIHLAAKVSFTGDVADFEAVNVGGTRNLLDAARSPGSRVRRMVQVSTPSVAHLGGSIVGEGAGPARPDAARGPYARTKAAAEVEALAASSADLRVIAVRPHIVWGPGDTQLVQRVVDRARAGRLPLLDGGHALIDSTYIDNAADAIVAALDPDPQGWGRAVVVSNGEPRPVAELIAGMCRAAGVRPPSWSVPGVLARGAGDAIEAAWRVGGRGLLARAGPGDGEPPMTRFLAEQLSTAHWFDQRETRRLLRWEPRVSLAEGFERLAAHAVSRPTLEG